MSEAPAPEELRIAGEIPALVWRGSGEGPRPAVIYLAGGGQTKRDVPPTVIDRLTIAGITAVSIDMYLHGEHQPAAGAANQSKAGRLDQFLELTERTARDLFTTVSWLREDPTIAGGRIGLRAISLSSAPALAALGKGLPVRACLSICGAGDFTSGVAYALLQGGLSPGEIEREITGSRERLTALDPLARAGAIPPRAVMFVHGRQDASVPYAPAHALYEALLPHYRDRPEDCVFVSHAGGHGIRPQLEELGWTWLIGKLKP